MVGSASGSSSVPRAHHNFFSISEHIVIALLVTSVVTLLWIPYALITSLGRNRAANGSVRSGLLHEGSGIIPWLMWLVCASIFTVRLCLIFVFFFQTVDLSAASTARHPFQTILLLRPMYPSLRHSSTRMDRVRLAHSLQDHASHARFGSWLDWWRTWGEEWRVRQLR